MVGGGGRTNLLLAVVILTIVHESLSGRSTVPTRNGDTSNIWARSTFFCSCYIHIFCLCYLFPIWPHLLSPRIAIVFSLLSNVPNDGGGGY